MTPKIKGRAGWHQATPLTTSDTNSTPITCRVKAMTVTLAVWGFFPIRWAELICQWGDDHDE
jgi:hypothetical protein